MSRFIPHSDMSADELMDCCVQAQAIISLCRFAGDNMPANDGAMRIGCDIDNALAVAHDLVGVMHRAHESHEGVEGGEK